MFGLSEATELFQGSTERTWNCVLHFISSVWSKLHHFSRPIMPKSRKRHHSRSRSPSHSRDRSRDRDDKHKKIDLHDKDRDGKRRKIDSEDSPHYKRSVSFEPEIDEYKISSVTESVCPDTTSADSEEITSLKPTGSTDNVKQSGLQDDSDGDEVIFVPNTLNSHTSGEDTPTKLTDVETIDTSESKITSSVESPNSDTFTVAVLNNTSEIVEPSMEGSTDINRTKTSTPNKPLTPKRLQMKLDSENKKQERQKAKEEKEQKKNEEKERIKQEKLKKKEEKIKELEQKQKDREQKDELKRKEREEKEELKRKEREEKEELKKKEKEEREQKRKEKEEREEQKRKEREQEKIKRQQEIEEKNKEKQKEEEKKQKAAAAFANFFVAKKNEVVCEETKNEVAQEEYRNTIFKAFEVKSDMKLPPIRRKPLTKVDIENIDKYMKEQNESVSYLKDIKLSSNIRSCPKTWPYEDCVDDDDDVAIVEDGDNLGETICEDKSRLQKFRAKFLKFHENRRPAYYGTWRKKSAFINQRKPFGEDTNMFNYEEDSDDDWEEEEQGESLNGSDDEADKELEDEKDDYEVDNEFFVPHGHLSDDEVDDEENAKLSPESLKQKLKLLKDAFDEDMKSKTHKLKPRSIGCIWYKKDGSNVDKAIDRYLQPLAVFSNGEILVKERSEINLLFSARKMKPLQDLNTEYIPMFIKVIHGNKNKKRVIIEQFITYMANNGIAIDIKKIVLLRKLQELARWERYTESGPLKNKYGWFVSKESAAKYQVNLELPNVLDNDEN